MDPSHEGPHPHHSHGLLPDPRDYEPWQGLTRLRGFPPTVTRHAYQPPIRSFVGNAPTLLADHSHHMANALQLHSQPCRTWILHTLLQTKQLTSCSRCSSLLLLPTIRSRDRKLPCVRKALPLQNHLPLATRCQHHFCICLLPWRSHLPRMRMDNGTVSPNDRLSGRCCSRNASIPASTKFGP